MLISPKLTFKLSVHTRPLRAKWCQPESSCRLLLGTLGISAVQHRELHEHYLVEVKLVFAQELCTGSLYPRADTNHHYDTHER